MKFIEKIISQEATLNELYWFIESMGCFIYDKQLFKQNLQMFYNNQYNNYLEKTNELIDIIGQNLNPCVSSDLYVENILDVINIMYINKNRR